MSLKDEPTQTRVAPPADVTALNDALRATTAAPITATGDRRQAPRQPYQVFATVEPVSVGPGAHDVHVVTRDADPRGTGFVSTGQLRAGSRAVMHLPTPDGTTRRIECRIRRSQEIGNGLFEGSVEFIGAQPQFSETRIRMTAVRGR